MLMWGVGKEERVKGKEQRQENFKMRMETKHRKLNQFLFFFFLCVTSHSFKCLLTKPIRTFISFILSCMFIWTLSC